MQVTNGNKILMLQTRNLLKDSSWAVAYGLTYLDSKEKTAAQDIFDKVKKNFNKFLNIVSP